MSSDPGRGGGTPARHRTRVGRASRTRRRLRDVALPRPVSRVAEGAVSPCRAPSRRARRRRTALPRASGASPLLRLPPPGRTPRARRHTSSPPSPGTRPCPPSTRAAARRRAGARFACCPRTPRPPAVETRALAPAASGRLRARPPRWFRGRRMGEAMRRMRSCGHHPGRRTDGPARGNHDRRWIIWEHHLPSGPSSPITLSIQAPNVSEQAARQPDLQLVRRPSDPSRSRLQVVVVDTAEEIQDISVGVLRLGHHPHRLLVNRLLPPRRFRIGRREVAFPEFHGVHPVLRRGARIAPIADSLKDLEAP